MWPFSKPKVTVYRTKTIDWSKVTTVEQVVAILQGLKLTQDITVGEKLWDDPVIKDILANPSFHRLPIYIVFQQI